MSAAWALLTSLCCCQHSSRLKTTPRWVTFVSGMISASPNHSGVSSSLLRLRVKYVYCVFTLSIKFQSSHENYAVVAFIVDSSKN